MRRVGEMAENLERTQRGKCFPNLGYKLRPPVRKNLSGSLKTWKNRSLAIAEAEGRLLRATR